MSLLPLPLQTRKIKRQFATDTKIITATMAHVIENNLLRINPNLFNVFPPIFLPAAGLWNPTAGKSIQGEGPEFSVLF
jgi:hypothetical protein